VTKLKNLKAAVETVNSVPSERNTFHNEEILRCLRCLISTQYTGHLLPPWNQSWRI